MAHLLFRTTHRMPTNSRKCKRVGNFRTRTKGRRTAILPLIKYQVGTTRITSVNADGLRTTYSFIKHTRTLKDARIDISRMQETRNEWIDTHEVNKYVIFFGRNDLIHDQMIGDIDSGRRAGVAIAIKKPTPPPLFKESTVQMNVLWEFAPKNEIPPRTYPP